MCHSNLIGKGLVTAILLLPVFASASTDLSTCQSLIPDNHNYQVVIKYDITKDNKEIKRFVGITDKNMRVLSEAQSKKIKPFVECVKTQLDK
jgi:hypothetical protein